MKPTLNPMAAREDFTDREFSKIIGGMLGALSSMGDIKDLRNAVRWWAETDQAWEMFEAQAKMIRAMTSDPPSRDDLKQSNKPQ